MRASVELWFLATLVLAQLYDWCAGDKIERLFGRKKAGLAAAVLAALGIGAFSMILYKFDLTKVNGFQRPDVVLLLLSAAAMFTAVQLGLQFWSSHPAWRRSSLLVTALIVLCYFAKPKFAGAAFWNNTVLMFCAIGIGVYVGHRVSRAFAYLFYTALFFFDIYAVWFSDIMLKMLSRVPDVIPAGFIIMAKLPVKDFLGAGDVIFGAIGAVLVRVFCGTKWSAAATLLYVVTLWLFGFQPFLALLPKTWLSYLTLFPVMVTICPITIACLLLGKRDES